MDDEAQTSGTYSSPQDIGTTDADIVRRWLLELDIAERSDKEWIKLADNAIKRYRGYKSKKNSFNILWSNTETLRQAIYNTSPKPDVRRRFRDDDTVAKSVSQCLERCIEYSIDAYDFDYVLKLDLLDMLLPGRGISRVKYIPDLVENVSDTEQGDENEESEEEAMLDERIGYETVICEHVNYKDFRHGMGKTWDEVQWVAFRHKISRHAGIEKFGKMFDLVTLDSVADETVTKAGAQISGLFKTATVWEIWDKDEKKVLFICPSYKKSPLILQDNPTGDDPLGLDGFFPVPRPLYAIEDSTTLEPVVLFEQYRQQADELDRVTARINVLVDALKLRGVYNSVMKEIGQLETQPDNAMIAATNVLQLEQSGGLEKNIWFMPIEAAANVISVLTQQRESCKAVIYEITGISDIMRGATDARETMGAQQIKTQWGTQRLRRLQAEFQRYVRDIIRLKANVIANKFQKETIEQMSGLKLADTELEKQQIQAQAQAFAQYKQSQQAPQQPPQQMPHQ